MKSILLGLALATLAACNGTAPPPDVDPAAPPASDAPPADTPPPVDDDDDTPAPPPGDDDDDDDTGSTIPARFHGEWNTQATACGTGNNASRLVIAADTIRFYESSGPVQSASVDDNELTVVARLTGEGETRDATYRFRLSADGNTLTDADSGLARQRCG